MRRALRLSLKKTVEVIPDPPDALLEEEGTVWASLAKLVNDAKCKENTIGSNRLACDNGASRITSQRSGTQSNRNASSKAVLTIPNSTPASRVIVDGIPDSGSLSSAFDEERRKWQAGVLSAPITSDRIHPDLPRTVSTTSARSEFSASSMDGRHGCALEDILEDSSQSYARVVFDRLERDLLPDSVAAISDDVAKIPLSKERLELLLRSTRDFRLTCDQLKTLVGMVSLDSHKKDIICERYVQVIDKEGFIEIVLDNFSRSASLKRKLLIELNAKLRKEFEFMSRGGESATHK